MRAEKKYKLFNGTIPSELLMFNIHEDNFHKHPIEQSARQSELKPGHETLSAGAAMLVNRLKKNQKQLAKWVKKNDIDCYRLYDADMPEYSAAIDIYGDHVHVQEYQAPKSIDEDKAQKRFEEIKAAVPVALGIDTNKISYKQRRRNRGMSQYEKLDDQGQHNSLTVSEGQGKFVINLWDYLDCGLFLDHRPVRQKIAEMARGKRFLNLFCYTSTASVQAALGGARYTVSVDMSNTYLSWARKNYALNGLSESKNRLEQADCIRWLSDCDQTFDLILLDPPSFSNSKRMEGVLDIQQDHVALIKDAMRVLEPGGSLIFSNNLRSFKMDLEQLVEWDVSNISAETLDQDFKRNPKIHQCWVIKHRT